MKTRLLVLIGLVILLIIVVGISGGLRSLTPSAPWNAPITPPPAGEVPDGVACTMDAKVCPDGSYVGRTGPNCEFSACPAPTPTPPVGNPETESMIETRIGKGSTAFDVSMLPLEVLEDSRCPVNVVCIQAGTVRVNSTVRVPGVPASSVIFSLNQPITVDNATVELYQVSPSTFAGGEPIKPAEYRFVFKVTKGGTAPAAI